MTALTSKQRAHLRGLAHGIKPVIYVGTDGVTAAVLQSILEAFNTRELLKLKVLETAPERVRETADHVVGELDGVCPVQTIGKTAVLYRRHPDNPEIRLP